MKIKNIFLIILLIALPLYAQENTEEKNVEKNVEQTSSVTESKQVKREEKPVEETKKLEKSEEKPEKPTPTQQITPQPTKPAMSMEQVLLKKIESNPKDPKPYFSLVEYYRIRQMDREMIKTAINYIQNVGGHPYMYLIIGDANKKSEDYSKALMSYQYALKLAPLDHSIYNRIGLVHLKLGNFHKAEAAFKAAIFFGRDIDNATMALYYNNLGLAYEAQKDIEEAINNFKISLKLNPYYEVARSNLKRLENR